MSMDTAAAKGTKDVTMKGVRIADGMMKKAWSILDAAVQKKPASDILNQRAIRSVQGKT